MSDQAPQTPASGVMPISVSIEDATKLTGISRSRIYELMNEGRLRSVHIGRRRLIPTASLRELLGEAVA